VQVSRGGPRAHVKFASGAEFCDHHLHYDNDDGRGICQRLLLLLLMTSYGVL
jgi:hypothetical protein